MVYTAVAVFIALAAIFDALMGTGVSIVRSRDNVVYERMIDPFISALSEAVNAEDTTSM